MRVIQVTLPSLAIRLGLLLCEPTIPEGLDALDGPLLPLAQKMVARSEVDRPALWRPRSAVVLSAAVGVRAVGLEAHH
jgi:hypothetical protein